MKQTAFILCISWLQCLDALKRNPFCFYNSQKINCICKAIAKVNDSTEFFAVLSIHGKSLIAKKNDLINNLRILDINDKCLLLLDDQNNEFRICIK